MASILFPMDKSLLLPRNGVKAYSVAAAADVVVGSKQKTESATAKFVIGGGVAWFYELCIGHFLEFLKIAKQTNAEKSYVMLTREITSQKGLIGVLDGFFPWGTVQAVAKGAVFSWAHALSRSTIHPLVESGRLNERVAEVIAGGIGGGFQGLVLSPTLLLKTRVMTDPIFRTNMSLTETTLNSLRVGMNVIRKEGTAALMKGSMVFSAKRVADWSTRYMFSEYFETLLLGQGSNGTLTTTEKVGASLLGGTASALCTIPLDVMVAQIMQASKAGQNVSVIESFKAEYKQGGLQQIVGFSTRGFVARVAHVALTTAIMKTGTSLVYNEWINR